MSAEAIIIQAGQGKALSLRGTQVAALFYTLCETAKLIGVDPRAYLLQALYAAIAQPGTVIVPSDLLVSTPIT